MPKRSIALTVTTLALAALGAPPTHAANQTVRTVDVAFMPSAVAVKPGETVTWEHPATVEPHSVAFADLSRPAGGPPAPTEFPWVATHTFTTPGAYRFFCENHGTPQGGGMAGIVYVNAEGNLPPGAPVANLTASSTSPQVGQQVTFNAAGSTDPGGSIVKYEWDIDGNGAYEFDTVFLPTTSRSFPVAGQRTIGLRVTDNQGLTGETQLVLTIRAAPTTPTPRPVAPVPPPVTGGVNTTPPAPVSTKIRLLSSRRLGRILRRGLRFEAGVPSNGASLRATLSARGRTLGTLRRSSLSRGRVKLTLKLSRRGKSSLKRLLANRRRVSAVMKVSSGGKTTRARVTLTR